MVNHSSDTKDSLSRGETRNNGEREKGERGERGKRGKEKVRKEFLTLLDVTRSPMPRGIKMIPTRKNVGRTVMGVRSGCHAFRRCCLKAESIFFFFFFYTKKKKEKKGKKREKREEIKEKKRRKKWRKKWRKK